MFLNKATVWFSSSTGRVTSNVCLLFNALLTRRFPSNKHAVSWNSLSISHSRGYLIPRKSDRLNVSFQRPAFRSRYTCSLMFGWFLDINGKRAFGFRDAWKREILLFSNVIEVCRDAYCTYFQCATFHSRWCGSGWCYRLKKPHCITTSELFTLIPASHMAGV